MAKKIKEQKCKDFAITEDELDQLINNTKRLSHVVMLTLLSFGMRAGEVAHAKKHWIHVGDKMSIQEGADYIEIPPKSDLCDCSDCLVRSYIEKHQERDTKYTVAWYKEQQKKFFALSKKKKLKYAIEWEPKSDAGKRKIWLLNKERANIVKEFFDNNESIGLQRRSIYVAVKNIGIKNFGKHSKKLFPHAIRSTVATIMAGKGANSPTLQHQMGWSTIALADRYVKPKEKMALMDLKDKIKSR